eukprot:Awhi_evm1s429
MVSRPEGYGDVDSQRSDVLDIPNIVERIARSVKFLPSADVKVIKESHDFIVNSSSNSSNIKLSASQETSLQKYLKRDLDIEHSLDIEQKQTRLL